MSQTNPRVPQANQLVAYNLRRARLGAGMTQRQAAEQLEPYLGRRWSNATFSVAERSAEEGTRRREFSADEILAFACAFGVPVTWFFLPRDDGPLTGASCGGPRTIEPHELIDAAVLHGAGNFMRYYGAYKRFRDELERGDNRTEEQ